MIEWVLRRIKMKFLFIAFFGMFVGHLAFRASESNMELLIYFGIYVILSGAFMLSQNN